MLTRLIEMFRSAPLALCEFAKKMRKTLFPDETRAASRRPPPEVLNDSPLFVKHGSACARGGARRGDGEIKRFSSSSRGEVSGGGGDDFTAVAC